MIKKIINKIFYPHTYNSEVYVKWLCTKGAKIGNNTRFIAPKKCNVDVGRAEYITIGSNCCLSMVTILAHDYSWFVLRDAYNDILPDPGGKVKIGDNCFIGYQACILKNTEIGNNVIIGARAVVKGKIPDNTVWAGVPAKQICTLEELYQKKKEQRITDAFDRYGIVKGTRKDHPTIEDMGLFAFLFLERNEKNYRTYISNIEFNGIVGDGLKSYFMESEPYFKNFQEFVDEYNKEQGE